ANLEGARNTLRTYKSPLSNAVDGRRNGLGDQMDSVEHFDAALRAAKAPLRRRRRVEGSSKDI
ncbi:MAG: hypothetical protein L3J78_04595, partial [Thermoplasmata archaeon]|nr:hypothetical protein [Thermoplasmata archaeon]